MTHMRKLITATMAAGFMALSFGVAANAGGADAVHWADAWKLAGGKVPADSSGVETLLKGMGLGQQLRGDAQSSSGDSAAKQTVPGVYCTAAATVLHLTEPSRFPSCNQPFFIDEGRLATLSTDGKRAG